MSVRRMLVTLVLVGCGGTVVETNAPDVGTDTASSDTGSECARICRERAAKRTTDGYCEPMLVGGDAGFVSCESWCDGRTSTWTSAERAAFERCALGDPLCFMTIDACMTR